MTVFMTLRYLALICGLVRLTCWDCARRLIPNRILARLLAVRLLLAMGELICMSEAWTDTLGPLVLGGILGGGVFLVVYILSRGGMGAGDVKLMAVAGAYLGTGIWDVIIRSLFLAAAWGLILAVGKKAGWKQGIPFAPFVLAGTIWKAAVEMGGGAW